MIEYIIGFFAALTLYQEINFFLIKRKIKGPVKIIKGAQPFFKKRGKKAALMIHGFTSSPKEFREMAILLAKNDITVYAPLLPGHGTSPERLAVTKYYQWIEAVDEAIKMLEKDYKEIFLIGNSFGGNLALISANKSNKIKGIITLGTPMFFHREKITRYVLFPILKRIKLFQKKKHDKDIGELDKRRAHYNTIPLRTLTHLVKIIELSKDSLKKIKTPMLIMETDNDTVARSDSGAYILNSIHSSRKSLVKIPESYHVFIIDKHRKKANEEVLKFIKSTK